MQRLAVWSQPGLVHLRLATETTTLNVEDAANFFAALGSALKSAMTVDTTPEGGVELIATSAGTLTAEGQIGLFFTLLDFPKIIVALRTNDATTLATEVLAIGGSPTKN